MTGALRYEWVRLRTLRSTWWVLIVALALNALVALAVARGVVEGSQKLDAEGVVTLLTGGSGISPLSITAVLAGVVGVLALGHEYRHDLIRPTLTAMPRRGVLLAAKAVVVGLWAALVAVAAGACAYGVGWAVIGDRWSPTLLDGAGTLRALGGFVALVVLTALLGVALAGMFRNVAAALVVLLVLPLLVEPVLDQVLRLDAMAGFADAGRFMPFTAAQRMIAVAGDGSGHAFTPLGPLAGGLTFLAFVAVLGALAAALFKLRDA
jgi:ABC-2 type transport system permease protein